MFKKKKLIILALSSSIFSIPTIVISCNQGKKDTNNRAQGNLKEKENFQESKMKIDFGYKELSNVFLVDFLKDLKTKTTLNDRLGKIIRTLPSDFFTYLKGVYLWDI